MVALLDPDSCTALARSHGDVERKQRIGAERPLRSPQEASRPEGRRSARGGSRLDFGDHFLHLGFLKLPWETSLDPDREGAAQHPLEVEGDSARIEFRRRELEVVRVDSDLVSDLLEVRKGKVAQLWGLALDDRLGLLTLEPGRALQEEVDFPLGKAPIEDLGIFHGTRNHIGFSGVRSPTGASGPLRREVLSDADRLRVSNLSRTDLALKNLWGQRPEET